MLSIPKNYPNYEELQKKSNVLKDLVEKLDEIDLQDSLLRIANLPEAQRNAWVRKMIADYTEAERKAAAEEAERMLAMQNAASYTNINNQSNSNNISLLCVCFLNLLNSSFGSANFGLKLGKKECDKKGFDEDVKEGDTFYEAENDDGYYLIINYSDSKMRVNVTKNK